MWIGKARYLADVTGRRWREFAASSGLDVDEVAAVTAEVRDGIAELFEAHIKPADNDSTRRQLITKHLRSLERAAQHDDQ